MDRNARFVRLLLGGAGVFLLVFFLATCAVGATCWMGGGAFVGWGIGNDLDEYRELVRSSNMGPEDQAEVLLRLDRIDVGLDEGSLVIPFALWVTHDAVIEEILRDKLVPPDELALLHDELTRIEDRRR